MYFLIFIIVLCICFGIWSLVLIKKRVFVLGGDGMFGSEIVVRLKFWGYDIMILYWGNWYWDLWIWIKFWVDFVRCDWDRFNECVDELVDIVKVKGVFDVVIDFSGYRVS